MPQMDAIHKRGQALENEYFQRVDQELLRKLRETGERNARIEELSKATGLHDDQVCEHLLDAGIDASNVAALTLTPIIFIAWASGTVSPDERQGVISAALRRGVSSNPLAFQLLEQWLETRPPRELWGLWKEYACSLHGALPPATADKLRSRLLKQSEAVALASGGVLGIGKICPAEQRVLDQIKIVLPSQSGDL